MTEQDEAVHENVTTKAAVNLLNQVIGEISVSLKLAEDQQLVSLKPLSDFVENECPDEAISEAFNRLVAAAKSEEEEVAPSWLSWIYGIPQNVLFPSDGIDTRRWILEWTLSRAHEIDELCAQRNLDFPVTPLLQAWLHRPRRVEAAPPEKRHIIPTKLAMVREGDRSNKRFAKFTPAAHVVQQPDGGQLVLPGFERADYPRVALPLELWRIGGGKETSPGRGVPWALRMFMAAVLFAPLDQRHGHYPLDIPVALRDLLVWLYPASNRPGPSRWWPQLNRAVEALEAQTARIPYRREDTGTLALRRVVSVAEIPGTPADLDGPVIFRVDLPPGSENGPQVSPNLLAWGARDAAAFRLLLNLAYYWHNPGRTLRPFGKRADGRGQFWSASRNPNDYGRLTDEELVAYAFPEAARKDRRGLLRDTREALKRLSAAGEVEIIEGHVLPPGSRG